MKFVIIAVIHALAVLVGVVWAISCNDFMAMGVVIGMGLFPYVYSGIRIMLEVSGLMKWE
jgi:hypothetical protein